MQLTPEQAKFVAGMVLPAIETESANTRKIIAAIPEDQIDFKLGAKGWTAGKLAWHIVKSEEWFANSIINGEFAPGGDEPPTTSVADIVKWYDATMPALISKLKQLSGEQLAKELDFMGVFKMSAANYLGFLNSHSIHHRGYLAAYLRAMNAHVPAIYGGSADEPFQMPASA